MIVALQLLPLNSYVMLHKFNFHCLFSPKPAVRQLMLYRYFSFRWSSALPFIVGYSHKLWYVSDYDSYLCTSQWINCRKAKALPVEVARNTVSSTAQVASEKCLQRSPWFKPGVFSATENPYGSMSQCMDGVFLFSLETKRLSIEVNILTMSNALGDQ